MNVREFLTKWGFEVSGQDKLNKLENQLDGIKRRLEFLGAVEVVKGLYRLAERFSHVGEELHIASQNAGITVEEFQRLAGAFAQTGVTSDEMQGGMAKLAKSLYAARNGSAEASKAFSDLGIDGSRVSGFKNAGEALLAVSDRMKGIRDPIQKSALAQQLLGRSSYQMIAALSQGSDAIKKQGLAIEKLGMVLSHDQVKNLSEFENTLRMLLNVIGGIAKVVAAEVAPGFTLLAKDAIKFLDSLRGLIGLNFQNWLYSLGFILGALWEAIKIGITLLIKLAAAFKLEGHIIPIVAGIGTFVTALYALSRIAPIVGGAFALLTGVWGQFAIMAGVVIIAAHDLFALFTGRKTWVEGIYEMLKPLGMLRDILAGIASHMTGGLVGPLGKLIQMGVGYMQGGTTQALAAAGGQGSVPGFGLVGPPAPPVGAGASAGIGKYEVNAPMTITVPPGTPPEGVNKSVKEGVMEHLDRVFREASVSTLSPQEY